MPKTAELLPPFRATPKQLELARAWHDPACRVVTIGGAIRSGKTQAAGRLIVETALEQRSVYLVARLTYRELEDSTKKALLHGDGSLPPLIPPETIRTYSKTDNTVELKNGSLILFRSLDEPGKLLNLTLGGILVDQIEELDGGRRGRAAIRHPARPALRPERAAQADRGREPRLADALGVPPAGRPED